MEASPGTVSVGNPVAVNVYLDTDAAPANALDGTLELSPSASSAQIKAIDIDHSILTLWPLAPTPSADGTHISFTGGLPGGFTGTHLLLFSITLVPQIPGSFSLTPTSATLYLNDGKGTATPVATRALTLTALPSQTGATSPNEAQSTPQRSSAIFLVIGLAVLFALAFGTWLFIRRRHRT